MAAWPREGPLLVFFGLLTLVNAPFDWLAIGLTRYFLRWGLALGGWWPVPFALLDAVSAAFSVMLLAFVCVLAVQVFGDIAVHFGGDERARIIHLAQVFKSLDDTTAPENLWIWFMLFSTAIPSVLNLLIACFAFLRSWPSVSRWISRQMADGEAMSEPAKICVATALAAQWAVGALATFWPAPSRRRRCEEHGPGRLATVRPGRREGGLSVGFSKASLLAGAGVGRNRTLCCPCRSAWYVR